MARAGFEKTERDNVYNGMTLREYARMSLTERGIGVSGYNPMQMVGAAFTHSTSDFGNILLDVANKPFCRAGKMLLKPMNNGRGKVSCLILKLPIVWVWGLQCSASGA